MRNKNFLIAVNFIFSVIVGVALMRTPYILDWEPQSVPSLLLQSSSILLAVILYGRIKTKIEAKSLNHNSGLDK
jgi:hypothetical protein